MEVDIRTIPHDYQRYETVGDYYIENGKVNIRVSDMGNEDYEFLVAIHEFIEEYLTRKRGIKEEDILKFDIEHGDSEEVGAEPNAPYYKEHLFASAVEMLLAEQLMVNWQEYDKKVRSL